MFEPLGGEDPHQEVPQKPRPPDRAWEVHLSVWVLFTFSGTTLLTKHCNCWCPRLGAQPADTGDLASQPSGFVPISREEMTPVSSVIEITLSLPSAGCTPRRGTPTQQLSQEPSDLREDLMRPSLRP